MRAPGGARARLQQGAQQASREGQSRRKGSAAAGSAAEPHTGPSPPRPRPAALPRTCGTLGAASHASQQLPHHRSHRIHHAGQPASSAAAIASAAAAREHLRFGKEGGSRVMSCVV